jgi:hypothetical protein
MVTHCESKSEVKKSTMLDLALTLEQILQLQLL